jgi:MSHA biogenesis protein MshJ
VAVVFSAAAMPAIAMPVSATPAGAAAASPGSAGAAGPAAAQVEPLPTLYKHGIEVTLRGDYPNLVAYMRELERNTKGVFWGDVKLSVAAYPEATLTMTIHTLSARPELSPVS